VEKLEWLGYPTVKKISKISLFVLAQVTIHERDGRTDTDTHTHTERQTLHADISRAYASHRAAKIKDMFTCFDRIHDRRTDRHTLRLCIASWDKTKQIIFDPLNSINLRPLLTLPGTSELVTFK